ncbi:Formylglycine-generating enzyme, required for sulfatase activity, contains SUMF1/FGE domain [Marinobacter daqiaonensis]|uniref:Formylglycine-generating enzyme, required for sulfatase activity, contains SUMF1/FGE domain n=1 Tax=Marinobacter daqiaonensis TaxID=650891 RepID=A0A1I6JVX1_9GAMM|nr:formylglycine-generating enzyme family protein [Marinobacter daqiaonensis]SFR83086.1 Formylglycine-generating enzyme, required for sulfatase activity, contains SUMF1/FGE domain [Marinobacter daqiaonensis]
MCPSFRTLVLASALLAAEAAGAESPSQFTNGLGMTFIQVPAGRFSMGSPSDTPGHEPDETLHEVTISNSYYLQQTEVTRRQWLALVDGVPSAFPECGNDCPVDGLKPAWVAWYIKALSEQDPAWDYRLPTEAEWEYAARAGTANAYYTGDCLSGAQANVTGRQVLPGCEPFGRASGPRPVASYPPNPWGFHDMLGNAWELCGDWYGAYPEGAQTDPDGPQDGKYKVLRGGSWHFPAVHARAANRFQARNAIAGFRLVAEPVVRDSQ